MDVDEIYDELDDVDKEDFTVPIFVDTYVQSYTVD
jgi:hypothetical protein